jgi:Rieske 2Fe-2S family protein
MSHAPPVSTPTLPSAWYIDAAHFRRELETIWFRDWIYAGRASLWEAPGDYRVLGLGDQRVVVLRDQDGELRAFHDTCRHRGSALCEKDSGHFAGGRIVCPYHAWSYALDGRLLATPRRLPSADFDPARYPLYRVSVHCWGGFVFVNLDPAPAVAFEDAFGAEIAGLSSWPLAGLRSAHREAHALDYNWKVFWDNYLECAHCPGVHPELCRLVPVYATGQLRFDDDPASTAKGPREVEARVREGARTWTPDGQCRLPEFKGLDEAAIAPGMRFATLVPSVFVIAHRDYVRTVSVRPLGPERTEVVIEWLVDPAVDPQGIDLAHLTDLGRQVVLQDARVSTLTQRGMHARPHAAGVLMPQEYDLRAFQQWVAARVRGEAAPAPAWEGDVHVESPA